jgi:hypothetical protein
MGGHLGPYKTNGIPGLETGSKPPRIGNDVELGKPYAQNAEGVGKYKKRTAACNGRHSPSRFGVTRKGADLY